PALVGLRLRMAMGSSALEQLDAVAGGDSDDGPLGVRPIAELVRASGPLALALAVHGVDLQHSDAPDRFDGIVDLGLRGPLVDHEGVGVGLDQGVALLAHDWGDDDVAWVLHASASASSASDAAARLRAAVFFGAGSTGSGIGVSSGSRTSVSPVSSTSVSSTSVSSTSDSVLSVSAASVRSASAVAAAADSAASGRAW